MKGKVWNSKAYDYSKGVIIYDPYTLKEYTEEQAREETKEIKNRLCVKGKIIGCWVKKN